MPVFHGIDFANNKAKQGECWLRDCEETLRAVFTKPDEKPSRTAVDCPFGTTVAFDRLLRGEGTNGAAGDTLKSRATERLLRCVVSKYKVNLDWKQRSAHDRELFPRDVFFNGGRHVRPTVGMVIVPEFLGWLTDHAGSDTGARREALRAARFGDGPIVESHPRLFLYSAIERIRALVSLPSKDLDAIAGYKGRGAEPKARRRRVYEILCSNPSWQGEKARRIEVDSLAHLVEADHVFDAWLSALTAWAHASGETWSWRDTGKLDESVVAVEGHILVLKQRP